MGSVARMRFKFSSYCLIVLYVASFTCRSADQIRVAPGLERRVMLSSIKAPRLPRRMAPAAAARQQSAGAPEADGGEPWATEAKEFLRSRLIGARAFISRGGHTG